MNVNDMRLIASLAALFSSCAVVFGDALEWPQSEGGNGHYYQLVAEAGITWAEANSDAQSREFLGSRGHLATLTTPSENAFVFSRFGSTFDAAWLGGVQDLGAPEPAGGWHWVTGEPWSYTNWSSDNPNDGAGTVNERFLVIWGQAAASHRRGRWNDAAIMHPLDNAGYVVEFPVPEPSTLVLLLAGASLCGSKRRSRA